MDKLKQSITAQLFVVYLRFLIGGSFVFASIIKIKGERFTTLSGASAPIDEAWHLFETLYASGLYWQFLGLGQLVAGLLLMTQIYARLGAVLFTVIASNIFIITLSYDFNYTPVITGMMLLSSLFLILWDWGQLKVLVNLPASDANYKTTETDKVWVVTGVLLFLFTALYRLIATGYDLIFWGSSCILIGLAGFVYWLLTYNKKVLQV